MPAWSVPGSQSASKPHIRFQRVRMSWSVLFKQWPMWSEPVTFGGGMTMTKGCLVEAGLAVKRPARFQPA